MKLSIEVPEVVRNPSSVNAALGITKEEMEDQIRKFAKFTMDFMRDPECLSATEYFIRCLREGKITDSMLLHCAIMGFKAPLDELERKMDAFRSLLEAASPDN